MGKSIQQWDVDQACHTELNLFRLLGLFIWAVDQDTTDNELLDAVLWPDGLGKFTDQNGAGNDGNSWQTQPVTSCYWSGKQHLFQSQYRVTDHLLTDFSPLLQTAEAAAQAHINLSQLWSVISMPTRIGKTNISAVRLLTFPIPSIADGVIRRSISLAYAEELQDAAAMR